MRPMVCTYDRTHTRRRPADSAYGCHTMVPMFSAMSEKPDLFQFLCDVRHQRPMLLVPMAEDDATMAGPAEVVIPAVRGPQSERDS